MKKDQVKRILVLDEVDVFFDERYFGEIYRPGIKIDGQKVRDLLSFIWKNRGDKHTKIQTLRNTIKNSQPYLNLVN